MGVGGDSYKNPSFSWWVARRCQIVDCVHGVLEFAFPIHVFMSLSRVSVLFCPIDDGWGQSAKPV